MYAAKTAGEAAYRESLAGTPAGDALLKAKIAEFAAKGILGGGAVDDVADDVGDAIARDWHDVVVDANKLESELAKPYKNSRPSYGKTQVEDVWYNNADPITGSVLDPTGMEITWNRDVQRKGQWDMGHIPGQKYSVVHDRYMSGDISLSEFLQWHRNPVNYRPEMPGTNRSHKFE